jgi:hypothetical protein
MSIVYKEIHLFYEDYKSDKEYHLIMECEENRYRVTAKFGPRGGTLTHVDKTKGLVTFYEAAKIFSKTEEEKRAKGYEDIETDRDKLIKRLKKLSGLHVGNVLWEDGWHKLAVAVETILEEVS